MKGTTVKSFSVRVGATSTVKFSAPGQVIRAFCNRTGARLEDLTGTSKTQSVTALRHELMYLLRQMTVLSLSDIGRHLGNRDMATVHAGIANVADRVAERMEYRQRLRQLKEAIIQAAADPIPTQVALLILQSPELSDAEARQAALQVLSGSPFPAQEVGHG